MNNLVVNKKHMKATTQMALALFAALLLSMPLLITGCKKTTDTDTPHTPTKPVSTKPTYCDTCLPPITTKGYNFFGCKINGKNWTPKDGWLNPGLTADIWFNQINISTYNSLSKDALSFTLNPINDTITIFFPANNLTKSTGLYSNVDRTIYYEADTLQTGFVQFSMVDYNKGIFSGTFAFNLYDRDGNIMHITDGRFDIKK